MRRTAGLLAALLLTATGLADPDPMEVHGIDVSHHQGEIDWQRIDRQQVQFVYVKATEGSSYRDPQLEANWQALHDLGIPKGAYHYFHGDKDALAQAHHYISTFEDLPEHDLPPAVDIEVLKGEDPAVVGARVRVWLETVEAAFGVKPVIYTVTGFVEEFEGLGPEADHPVYRHPIWYAKYDTDRLQLPEIMDGFELAIWQYGQGEIDGIDGVVDLNTFNGDRATFEAFLLKP